MKKICVVGAGAIGGRMAAKLAASGNEVSARNEVSLIARGEHLRAIVQNGLRIEEWTNPLAVQSPASSHTVRVEASDSPEALAAKLGPQDLIIIALKAHQIGAILPQLKGLIAPHTVVLPAINGLPWWYFHRDGARHGQRVDCLDASGEMARDLDNDHVLGCVVHASAEVIAPGVIKANGQNKLVIGEPSHEITQRVKEVAALLEAAGFEVKQSARIRDDVWMKLVGNASFNPVAALTFARMDQINENEALIDLIKRMMEEVMAVARAYNCDPLLGVEQRIAVGRGIGAVKISMHQDAQKRRPLEIDAIVRAPVELGRRAGVAMPFTESVLALVSEYNERVVKTN
jgi:2-dehydropantoate 2-reductase